MRRALRVPKEADVSKNSSNTQKGESTPISPDDINDTTDLNAFMEVFHDQIYSHVKPDDMAEYRIDGEDPIWEVEKVVTGKGTGTSLMLYDPSSLARIRHL